MNPLTTVQPIGDDGPMALLIGRDHELTVLTDLLGEVAGRRPATVMLDGDAGVGKTYLVTEFAKTARAAGAVVLAGGCLQLDGGAIPYGPLIEALRMLVRQVGETQARELAGPAWTELADLIADFTVGGESTAPTLGAQTRVFGAVSRLLDHIGEQQPLVLVFEDMHWADTATLDLMAYLALTNSDQRMMLLCTYRSGLRLGHPLRTRLAEPEFTRRVHRVSLSPFTNLQLRAFVAALTDSDVSPERADRYFELSEGNPYFTEQLVAAGFEPHVPDSLGDLMLVRLTRLSENATKVVRVAAVAGRRVSDALLAKVVGLDDAALDAALTECLADRILVEDRVDDSYSFQHALLRETAYDTLRSRERKRLHAELAEALAEEAGKNPHVLPELAYHWSVADRVPQALRAAIGAGDLAVRLRAFQEAENQYHRVLDLWSQLPDAEQVAGMSRMRVLGVAADAARWAGHLKQAVAWAVEAVRSAAADADPAVLGALYERLGSYRWEAGFDVAAVQAYSEARQLLSTGPPSAAGARACAALATAAAKRGGYTGALAMARTAEQEARAAGAIAEIGRAKNSSGLALTLLGRHRDGIAELREALRIATEADHLEDMVRAWGNLGVCLERAGQVAEAADVFQQGLDRSRELGLLGSRQAGLLANNACATLFLLGRWAEAGILINEVMRYYPLRETVFQRLTKAEMDLATGRVDEAERLLESVRDQPNSQPRFLSPLYRCLAELAALRGNPDAALDTVRRGIEAITDAEDHMLVLQLCAFGLRVVADMSEGATSADDIVARARTAAENTDEAESAVLAQLCDAESRRRRGIDTASEWEALAEAWRALQRPYPMAYALARLASAAAKAGDRTTASVAATEAGAIAEDLGAEPLHGMIMKVVRAHRLTPRSVPVVKTAFGLTVREVEVLSAADKGLTNQQIGTQLGIAKPTVGAHLSNIYKKLGASGKVEALGMAREAGLFEDR